MIIKVSPVLQWLLLFKKGWGGGGSFKDQRAAHRLKSCGLINFLLTWRCFPQGFQTCSQNCFLSDLHWLVFWIRWIFVRGHLQQLSSSILFRHMWCALCSEKDWKEVPKNHSNPAENSQQRPVPCSCLWHGPWSGQEISQAIGAAAVLWCRADARG